MNYNESLEVSVRKSRDFLSRKGNDMKNNKFELTGKFARMQKKDGITTILVDVRPEFPNEEGLYIDDEIEIIVGTMSSYIASRIRYDAPVTVKGCIKMSKTRPLHLRVEKIEFSNEDIMPHEERRVFD